MTNRDRFPAPPPAPAWDTNRYPPRRIGGVLNYAVLAQQHRPTDQPSHALAARDLAAQGLTAQDIAAALSIGIDAAAALLESRPITPSAASRSAPLAADESAAIHHSAWISQRAGEPGKEST